MKYPLIALLVCLSVSSFAQNHHVFADVGWTPGLSVTYNYTPAKRLGIGIGIQGYDFNPTMINSSRLVPALFADIRVNVRPNKNNQFFPFWDLGINFYKQDSIYRNTSKISYSTPKDNGLYTGMGFGYLRRVTKRGGGPYASVKMIMNWTVVKQYSIVSHEPQVETLNIDARLVFSVGFKF